MLGNTVVFKCEVPAFAKDYVTVTSWSRSGTIIVAGGRFSIFPWGELHIRDARVEDKEYQYSCSTRNTLLQTTKSSDFKKLTLAVPVNIKPEIIDSVVEHTISIGEEIELPCAASGHPSPEYQWTKDGSSVTLSERITLRRGNLVVSNAVLDDGGSYQCTAENNFGSNTVSRNLVVRGKGRGNIQMSNCRRTRCQAKHPSLVYEMETKVINNLIPPNRIQFGTDITN
ncbi:putative Down syndrome cell adhesion molecule-like [Apostichopus japonicus]|uniref:Putative Down syndrome cell adhesion molecule-like n=1 Tax=Stichopus japonicus TaxID=307972 RepID=A0A2G8L2Z7_STIJA|nr:putative Down syndrome cell adhesion molecule-like [Apostichopus japonicus]